MSLVRQEGEEETDGDSQEVVTATEVRERLREMARQNEVWETLDPNDVSWLDRDHSQDEDEGRIRIKAVSLMSKRPAPRRSRDQVDFDGNFEAPERLENEQERARMSSWAKSEGKSRNVGTGRSAVGAAVTGHRGKPRVKAGGGSLRTAQASSSGSTGIDPRKVTVLKTSSMLAVVADRSLRFDER